MLHIIFLCATGGMIIGCAITSVGYFTGYEILKRRDVFRLNLHAQKDIFFGLLRTFNIPFSDAHINSLRMIDIEFYDSPKIRRLFHLYINNLWGDERTDLLCDLLYAMSIRIGYNFDKNYLIYVIDTHICPDKIKFTSFTNK